MLSLGRIFIFLCPHGIVVCVWHTHFNHLYYAKKPNETVNQAKYATSKFSEKQFNNGSGTLNKHKF